MRAILGPYDGIPFAVYLMALSGSGRYQESPPIAIGNIGKTHITRAAQGYEVISAGGLAYQRMLVDCSIEAVGETTEILLLGLDRLDVPHLL